MNVENGRDTWIIGKLVNYLYSQLSWEALHRSAV